MVTGRQALSEKGGKQSRGGVVRSKMERAGTRADNGPSALASEARRWFWRAQSQLPELNSSPASAIVLLWFLRASKSMYSSSPLCNGNNDASLTEVKRFK